MEKPSILPQSLLDSLTGKPTVASSSVILVAATAYMSVARLSSSLREAHSSLPVDKDTNQGIMSEASQNSQEFELRVEVGGFLLLCKTLYNQKIYEKGLLRVSE